MNMSAAQEYEASRLMATSMRIDQDLHNRTTWGDGEGQAELYTFLTNEGIDKKAFLSYYVRRQVMNDVKRRCKSPVSKRMLRDAQDEQSHLRETSLNETSMGHNLEAAQANSDCAYLRAKTEVMVNHEEHRYRMLPKNVYKTRSIVNYHWSPKKRRQMQNKIQRVTEPIENQTLEEVWQTIQERKEAKMDVTNVLDGLNLTRSYQHIVEEQRSPSPAKKKGKKSAAKRASPRKSPTKKKLREGQAHYVAASPPQAREQASPQRTELSAENLQKKDWSFVADNDILERELELGRDLIAKAIEKLTPEILKTVTETELGEQDIEFLKVHMGLSDLARGETQTWTWDNIKNELSNGQAHIDNLKGFAAKAEEKEITPAHTQELKDAFIQIQN